MSLLSDLLLRFDGSFRGGAGGAGAVILSPEGVVQWQGARFLSACPTSAHSEYEGLLLGLEAAVAYRPSALRIEGDCRVVLDSISGKSKSRKLKKLHTRATAALSRLPLVSSRSGLYASGFAKPDTESIAREENAHADSLSRAAVDAAQQLHAAAVLASVRGGDVEPALALVERAARERVTLAPLVFDELLETCHDSQQWHSVLSAFRAASAAPNWTRHELDRRDRAYVFAGDALEAMGASSRGSDPASKQLLALRREQEEMRRMDELKRLHADDDGVEAEATVADETRGVAAREWRESVVERAGGEAAWQGNGGLESVPLLLRTAESLAGGGVGL